METTQQSSALQSETCLKNEIRLSNTDRCRQTDSQTTDLAERPLAWKSFLRSFGLKILSELKARKIRSGHDDTEEEKIILNQSRLIAVTRTAVHLLPVLITTFLIAFNVVEVLNGPDISSTAKFFLQVAAKIQELAITGSLSIVVLDAIRYQLLHEGLNLGLLSSGFSFVGLNFLFSSSLWSTWKARYPFMSKFRLLFIIITCCTLASVVGPASALLFLPIEVWMGYGSTEYYLRGTADDLWPNHLTLNHTGPEVCRQNPSLMYAMCPFGGYPALHNRHIAIGSTQIFELIEDPAARRTLHAQTYSYTLDSEEQETTETWAIVPRGDITSMMTDLENAHNGEINNAIRLGRASHLNDFVDGRYTISGSQVPVGRAVCGPPLIMNNVTRTLPFPVLSPEHKWRNISLGSNSSWGELAYREIDALLPVVTDTTLPPFRARWLTLNTTFGAASAGLAMIITNNTMAIGRGCTIDCRWASGQTFGQSGQNLGPYESHIGRPATPGRGIYVPKPQRDFFDPHLKNNYSPSIKIDQEWLDATFPPLATRNLTTFEDFLDGIPAGDLAKVLSNDPKLSWSALTSLEYLASILIIDAISRTGWSLMLAYQNDAMVIRPDLQHMSNRSRPIFKGGPLFDRPTDFPYTVLSIGWNSYGTAWTLREPGQYLSIAILIIHAVIAISHALILVSREVSTEAWDSVDELIVLAWNSTPTRRDHEFRNCGGGISRIETLRTKVKAVSILDPEQEESRIELTVVDEKGRNKDGRVTQRIKRNEPYH